LEIPQGRYSNSFLEICYHKRDSKSFLDTKLGFASSEEVILNMRQFKIKYNNVPIEYKSTPEYIKAINKIKEWKQNIFNFPLSLSRLNLKWLPILPNNIKTLYCGNNQLIKLSYLPKTLEVLSCYKNQLTHLPQLPNTLKTLHCGYNNLTSLPTLPNNLQVLYCNNNRLTELPNFSPDKFIILYCGKNQLN